MGRVRERVSTLYLTGAIRYAAARGDLLARLLVNRPGHDPYPLYEQVRERGVVNRSALAPVYVSASHAFVSQALRDPGLEVFDQAALPAGPVRPVEDSFLMRNRPDHARLRRLVTPWFTAKALQHRRDALEAIAHRRLDELGEGPFDVVQDYAVPVAVRVICELTGLPVGEWRRLAALGGILAVSTSNRLPTRRQHRELLLLWRDLNDYLDDTIAAGSAPEGSLVSALSDRYGGPGELTRHDLLATLGVLLIAGFETSVGLMGGMTSRFLGDPELRRGALADREVLVPAMEESLRLEPPVQFTARRVPRDTEVAGVALPAHSEVMLLLAGANRDPEVFEAPGEFRPERANSRSHLAFSGGEHYCVGAGLARLETEVALRALFERRPGLRRAGRPRWQRAQNIRALRTLPVRV
ncbi:cytochrome P450 [Kineosporia sp. J2-2]|uniref:Cytochrome P450 n=1 Tax=Kineosporia corallincola TaxID=2835133 RepID=A0ABS5TIC8_9ACTN|nr:cytochrome P450 [Kineosporia corallincola]MBT0770159.1 cytochrome P450 [Kineosporia corallincola]